MMKFGVAVVKGPLEKVPWQQSQLTVVARCMQSQVIILDK
jgi:hypothetical protein